MKKIEPMIRERSGKLYSLNGSLPSQERKREVLEPRRMSWWKRLFSLFSKKKREKSEDACPFCGSPSPPDPVVIPGKMEGKANIGIVACCQDMVRMILFLKKRAMGHVVG